MRVLGAFCALAFLSFSAAESAAQSGDNFVPPAPASTGKPTYPQDAPGEEAWVEVSFTVKADGTTADFAVTDGFYSAPFERTTISAARNWKFKPGTEDGKAIDWRNYKMDVPYVYVDVAAGVYPEFSARYTDIIKSLEQKQFADAKSRIAEAFDDKVVKLLYEYAVIQLTLHAAEKGLGNRQAAYRAIRRATPVMRVARTSSQQPETGTKITKQNVQLSATTLLPDATLKRALRDRFAAEATLGQYLDALETYERLGKMEDLAADPLAQQVQLIRNALSSDQPLGVKGRMEKGKWSNRPARRTFSFADVKGTIQDIRVACTGHVETLKFQAGAGWTMPPTWGDCELEASGSDGTEFIFVQTGPASPARPTPPEPLVVSPPQDGTFIIPMPPQGSPAPSLPY